MKFVEIKDQFNFGLMLGQSAEISVNGIVNIVLGLIIVACLLPIGIEMFMDSELGAGTGAVASVWKVVPVIVVIGVVIGLVNRAI